MKTFNLLVAFALRRRWRFARALAYFPRSTNPEEKQGTAGSLYLLWALKVHLMETPPFWITHDVISSDLKTLAGWLHWLKNLAWLIFSIDETRTKSHEMQKGGSQCCILTMLGDKYGLGRVKNGHHWTQYHLFLEQNNLFALVSLSFSFLVRLIGTNFEFWLGKVEPKLGFIANPLKINKEIKQKICNEFF